jgi:hypothetical protein
MRRRAICCAPQRAHLVGTWPLAAETGCCRDPAATPMPARHRCGNQSVHVEQSQARLSAEHRSDHIGPDRAQLERTGAPQAPRCPFAVTTDPLKKRSGRSEYTRRARLVFGAAVGVIRLFLTLWVLESRNGRRDLRKRGRHEFSNQYTVPLYPLRAGSQLGAGECLERSVRG